MKKIFTLVMALVAMTICAKAQTTFIYESFDNGVLPDGWTVLDADGDTYTWDALIPFQSEFNTHSGASCITSASYVNNVGALTPDNWLITPQFSVSAGDELTFWVAGQDPNYAAENFGVYVSTTGTNVSDFTSVYQGTSTDEYTMVTVNLNAYAGQNIYIAFRHYNTTDMYMLNLDDVTAGSAPADATFNSYTSALNFGQVINGTNKVMTATFTAFSLTDNVTVTTAAPFQVSADGTTFGTTATIAANTGAGNITNGEIYVRFAPTALGAATGTVTLASTGATSVNINLAGEGFSCDNTSIPYTYRFDDEAMGMCWTINDANNDGETFAIDYEGGYAAYFYSETENANDWLISPAFQLNGNQYAEIDYFCASSMYPESFEVYVIDNNGNETLVVNQVTVTNQAEETQQVNLSNFNGTYKVGIKCTSQADMYAFAVTRFTIDNGQVGIADVENATRIYPNPANNVLNIQATSNINMVEVFNMVGQRVASYNANDVFTAINTSNLNAGVYTVRIHTENGVATQKFMVAR